MQIMHAKTLPQLSALLQYYCRKKRMLYQTSTALFKSWVWNDADL